MLFCESMLLLMIMFGLWEYDVVVLFSVFIKFLNDANYRCELEFCGWDRLLRNGIGIVVWTLIRMIFWAMISWATCYFYKPMRSTNFDIQALWPSRMQSATAYKFIRGPPLEILEGLNLLGAKCHGPNGCSGATSWVLGESGTKCHGG